MLVKRVDTGVGTALYRTHEPKRRNSSTKTYLNILNIENPCELLILFFACPKKRTKRKGSRATETTPFAEVWNRRGKNSLRSNSLPLHPAPNLAARLSGNGNAAPSTKSDFKKLCRLQLTLTCNPPTLPNLNLHAATRPVRSAQGSNHNLPRKSASGHDQSQKPG